MLERLRLRSITGPQKHPLTSQEGFRIPWSSLICIAGGGRSHRLACEVPALLLPDETCKGQQQSTEVPEHVLISLEHHLKTCCNNQATQNIACYFHFNLQVPGIQFP